MMKEFAMRKKADFFFVSAKKNLGIDEVFQRVADKLMLQTNVSFFLKIQQLLTSIIDMCLKARNRAGSIVLGEVEGSALNSRNKKSKCKC